VWEWELSLEGFQAGGFQPTSSGVTEHDSVDLLLLCHNGYTGSSAE
jgi:hypothetical protein